MSDIAAPFVLREVVLSANEIRALAARVLAAAEMPVGCIGGAADAIAFLEESAGAGLSSLDADLEEPVGNAWIAPEVRFEADGLAMCNGQEGSALFFGPALAEWAAAWAFEFGSALISVAGFRHPHYLSAIAYRLALRGLSGCVLVDAPGCRQLTAIVSGDDGWVCAHIVHSPLADAASIPKGQHAGDNPEEGLHTLRSAMLSWLTQLRSENADTLPLPDRLPPRDGRDSVVAVCAAVLREGRAATAERRLRQVVARAGRGSAFWTGADLAGEREAISSRGRPIDIGRWSRLMAFADRALIPTSEQSRLGAG